MSTTLQFETNPIPKLAKHWTAPLADVLTPPRNREHYDSLCDLSYQLSFDPKCTKIKEIEGLLQVIDLLIDDYDRRHTTFSKSDPVGLLKELMERHGLTQKDFKDEIGSQGLVSQVLNEKRPINLRMAKNLAERFKTSPELFIK